MTTIVTETGNETLDLSVSSVEIKARQGETLVYEQQFFSELVLNADRTINYDESETINISTWDFEAGIRDGSLLPHLPMDVKKYGPNGAIDSSSFIVSFDTSELATIVRANSFRDFYFEVSAMIPLGQVDSEGNAIIKKQTVLVGIIKLFADIYDAPLTL